MKKQVYIHTAFTILSAKKFVEPLALSLDFNKYDVELWIDPFEGYFNNKAIFSLPVKYVDMRLKKIPTKPTSEQLQRNGRNFPPNYLHESWRDYLYWDTELIN